MMEFLVGTGIGGFVVLMLCSWRIVRLKLSNEALTREVEGLRCRRCWSIDAPRVLRRVSDEAVAEGIQ